MTSAAPPAFSVQKSRIVLIIVWFAFFVANIAMLMYLYFDKWIEADNFNAGLLQIFSLYLTYLGVMITFFFADDNKAALKKKRAGATFVVALAVSLLWNAFVCGFIAKLIFLGGEIEVVIKQIGDYGPLLSWLPAPAIGYYFAKS